MALLLVIEDDPEQLALRRMMLEVAGHEVLEADSARAAAAQLDRSHPQAIILDLRLPREEDGIALAGPLASRIPVIVLTGASLSAVKGLPVFRALRKPCPAPDLLKAVEDAVSGNGNRG
ncbi:MAG TPA: response regulator [Bryobacteraceae bacterium]|jgi:two-component system KDP operon response regulator KdpE|nr:response regulator [Bryobacteraceae bacterium]HVW09515.1 response regulator [Bryobacteraceae bacterium]